MAAAPPAAIAAPIPVPARALTAGPAITRGLSFLTGRGRNPTPREKPPTQPSTPSARTTGTAHLQPPPAAVAAPPRPIVESPAAIDVPNPLEQLPKPKKSKSLPMADGAGAGAPIEAVLLDRKRRLTTRPATPVMPVKGQRFKSSPLDGGDRRGWWRSG
ncbi:hypothetical protein HWV62_4896 [Athelia sp. TMB]|nr:hypothetical protein HWV62_4896 [Athelia sp. TMB]